MNLDIWILILFGICDLFYSMPEGGFEPPCPKAYAPQAYVSANSTTPAIVHLIIIKIPEESILDFSPVHFYLWVNDTLSLFKGEGKGEGYLKVSVNLNNSKK